MVVAVIVSSKPVSRFVIPFSSWGDPSVGNRLLRPLREPIKPEGRTEKVMSYQEAQTTEFPQPPKPLPFFETSLFFPNSMSLLLRRSRPQSKCASDNKADDAALHGAVTRIPVGDSAFPLRESGHVVELRGGLGYARRRGGREAMDESSSRCPRSFFTWDDVNHLSEPSDNDVRAAYGPNYGRLVEIKKKYDPTNVLVLNPNIKPA